MATPGGPAAASRATDPPPPSANASAARVPSFRSVYASHFGFVWNCARRLGVPEDAADDVVQEIFLVVHARLWTLERPKSLRSWLYSVVRRTVSTYHRDRHARASRESSARIALELISAGVHQSSPLDFALLSDEVQLLWALLATLTPSKREILVLAELEEMTVPEIAEAIGVPLNTAYSRLRLARHDLYQAYASRIAGGSRRSTALGERAWRRVSCRRDPFTGPSGPL
jgi:RNA polymerase sigma-70 factor (ECF subfamily)